MSRYHERYGLTPIINTAGTQTTLGASSIPPQVVERVVEAAPEFARMTELLAAADVAIGACYGRGGRHGDPLRGFGDRGAVRGSHDR